MGEGAPAHAAAADAMRPGTESRSASGNAEDSGSQSASGLGNGGVGDSGAVTKDVKLNKNQTRVENGNGASGSTAVRTDAPAPAAPSSSVRKTISDFKMGMLLGEGGYARVHVCKLKGSDENDCFAVKVMEKKFIIKEGKIKFVNMEKQVLSMVEHPLLARLYFSFHDQRTLYMVMDLCRGGELQKLIAVHTDRWLSQSGINNRALPLEQVQFYFAETVSAVQYLHNLGFVHRDIKPDNILLCGNGHIKLTDFGTVKDERSLARELTQQNSSNASVDPGADESEQQDARRTLVRRGTFCGTAEYVSPEVLQDASPSVGADYWALGCLLYQLVVGAPPFRASSEYFTFQLIMSHGKAEDNGQLITIPARQKSEEFVKELPPSPTDDEEDEILLAHANNILNQLLISDPARRLGAANNCSRFHPDFDADSGNGPEALRAHPFIAHLNLETLHETVAPPLPYSYNIPEPSIDGESDQWMLAGDITELELAAALEITSSASNANSCGVPGEIPKRDDNSSSTSDAMHLEHFQPQVGRKASTSSAGELAQFLHPEETIVLDGLVVKRKGIFHVNTRHLVLTSLPRFVYIDPVKVVLKGEIPITNEVYINVKNSKTFDIVTPKRTYHMTDLMSQATRWSNAFGTVKNAMGHQ